MHLKEAIDKKKDLKLYIDGKYIGIYKREGKIYQGEIGCFEKEFLIDYMNNEIPNVKIEVAE